jgi:hypothetical protein
MKQTRTGKRRAAAINSVKVLLTSASLAATLGGWAAISAANGSPLAVAQVNATATVQTWLDSRSTEAATTTSSATLVSANQPAATQTSAAVTTVAGGTATNTAVSPTTATAVTAAVAPTATAPTTTFAPTQVVVQPTVTTRSSR